MTRKWSAFLVVSLGTTLGTLDISGLNVALPTFARLFGVAPETALWVVLSYILTYTGFALTAGRLADMVGRKRVYALGFLIVTLGLALALFGAMRRVTHETALPGTIDDLDRARLGLVLGFQDALLVSTASVAAGLFIVLAFGRR